MSARLHESLGYGKLTVRNRSSGEVMLYYKGTDNSLRHVCLQPHTPINDPIDLLTYASLDVWRQSPNLVTNVNMGLIEVVL